MAEYSIEAGYEKKKPSKLRKGFMSIIAILLVAYLFGVFQTGATRIQDPLVGSIVILIPIILVGVLLVFIFR